MIADPKPYPAMKDSGVSWLGEVPEHWEVKSLGRIGQLFKGNGGNKGDEVPSGIPCVRYGDLYTRHEFFIRDTKSYLSPERAAEYTPIRYGDVLFAASGETIEEIGRSAVNLMQSEARCGGDVLLLRPAVEAVPKFLGYAADSTASRNQKACMGRGFTVVHIYGSQLKRLVLPLPPLPEQAAIVRFLDYADRRIRRYVRAKQKLIKLLEEQKQAIIHRAVTRGLDPNVRLKPSGVEWLGVVPEHWEVRRLKQCCERFYSGGTPESGTAAYYCGTQEGIPWLMIADLTRQRRVRGAVKHITEAGRASRSLERIPKGTLVYSMYASLGAASILEIEATVNQAIIGIEPRPTSLDAEFALYFLQFLQPHVARLASSSTQANLNAEKVKSLPTLLPPLAEQAAIVRFLDEQTQHIAATIDRAQREISLLREYRTRLIADVVTGKLDVREVAARLPDAADEPEPLGETDDPSDADGATVDYVDGSPAEAEA